MKYFAIPAVMLSAFAMSAAFAVSDEVEHFVSLGALDGYTALNKSEFTPAVGYHALVDNTHRWSLGAAHSINSNYTTTTGSYDYLYNLDSKWAIFGGISAGYSFAKSDDGVLAGGQFGSTFEPVENMKVELGYRIHDTLENWKDRDMSRIEGIYFGFSMKV
ncbi:hypothetical protein [Vibrio sp. Isolate30]|jgi:hypothetical protein|uniref:hypothetical protein n=1 Tax=Vibrio TaxID=662 RepID=UPI001EFD6DB6|nr:hypothetical protein [Vibrio sp. Isolate30]MCG9629225.1 hypothetical protein [Vibrio sp. Isolate30]